MGELDKEENLIIKPCPSFPGYFATSDGRIISDRKKSGTVMRGYKTKKGYFQFPVTIDGIRQTKRFHQLIADAFHGPCPTGQMVRHKDGNPANNLPSNLEYGDAKANAADRKAHGRYYSGERNPLAKLSDTDALMIRAKRDSGWTLQELSAFYGVSARTLSDIIKRKSYVSPPKSGYDQ